MKKKLLSFLLAAIMILSLIPVIAVPASATSSQINIIAGSFEGYKGWLKANDGQTRYKQRAYTYGLRDTNPITNAFDGNASTWTSAYSVVSYYPEQYINASGELVRDKTYDNVEVDVDFDTYQASGLGKYYGVFKFTLETLAELDTVTIKAGPDGSKVDSNKAFDILYSADGEHWAVAASYTNMTSGSSWTSWDGSLATLTVPMNGVEAGQVAFAVSAASGKETGGLWLFEIAVTGEEVSGATPAISVDGYVVSVSNYTGLKTAVSTYGGNSAYTIQLVDDIIMEGSWSASYVKGTFDGQGHTIYNLQGNLIWPYGNSVFQNFTISNKTAPDGNELNLSGKINIFGGDLVASEVKAGETAILRNITNERATLGSGGAYGAFFGGVNAGGTIRFENCINNGNYWQTPDISVNNSYYGNNHKIGSFIASLNGGTVEFIDCINNASIIASQAGGFIGVYNNTVTITMTNCENRGTIIGMGKAEGAYGVAGGFIGGQNNNSAIQGDVTITMTNCVNTGNIQVAHHGTWRENAIGGLIGFAGGQAAGKTLSITLNNCGVYNCTIDTNGANEYAAPLIGKCSPGASETFHVVAAGCYISKVDVRSSIARRIIGVGTNNTEESVIAYNCIVNEVTENGSEEWGGSRHSGLNVNRRYAQDFANTDEENAINRGGVGYVQEAIYEDGSLRKIRFVSTIRDWVYNSEDYEKVGFYICIVANVDGDLVEKAWNVCGTTLYENLNEYGSLGTWNAKAKTKDKYAFAATLNGIPADLGGAIYVTPYIVDTNGRITFGSTGSANLGNGL